MKKQYNILLFLVLIPFLGFSNDDFTYSKQRNIKKAYIVNSDAGINIDNSYGTIFVTTWDEDKIEIDVLIKVSGDSEKWVNQKLAGIDVDFIALKSMVTAKTIFENTNTNKNGRNNNFEVNYTIKIPRNGTVKLNNKYGNIITSDLFSTTDINCKYGKINLGKLNGSSNTIQIGYCSNSTITYLKNAAVTSKYSELKIEAVSKLDLLSDYSEIEINEGNDVKYNSKYGSVKIQKVNSLEANGNYLTIDIGSLSNQLKLNTKYSNVSIDAIQAKANNVTIVAGYTGVDIGFQPNYVFDFEVSVKYADFKYDNELDVSSKEETNYAKKVSGFFKKKGVNKITITSDYGNVKLFKNP
jgi:formylmethanofuran dehydrogenase subunit D